MGAIKVYITSQQQRDARKRNMKRYRDKLKKIRELTEYRQAPKVINAVKTKLYSNRKAGLMYKVRKHFNVKVIPEIKKYKSIFELKCYFKSVVLEELENKTNVR